MTIPRHDEGPIPGAADVDPERGASPARGRFARGLTLGALVGAAIAGSAIWDRLRGNRVAQELVEHGPQDRTVLDVSDDRATGDITPGKPELIDGILTVRD